MKPDTTPKQNQHVLTDCAQYEKQALMWRESRHNKNKVKRQQSLIKEPANNKQTK